MSRRVGLAAGRLGKNMGAARRLGRADPSVSGLLCAAWQALRCGREEKVGGNELYGTLGR